MTTPRVLYRWLSASSGEPPSESFWSDRRYALARCAVLVRVFYGALFYLALERCPTWPDYFRLEAIRPIWPVAWLEWTGIQLGLAIVLPLSLLGPLAAFVFPRVWLCRAVAAISMFFASAFYNSFGSINHGWHAWVWTAALFVFLPDGGPARVAACTTRQQRYFLVFWSAQAALLLFYSMSGAFKLAGAAAQIVRGEVHAFAPEALPRHTIYKMLEVNFEPPGSFIGVFLAERPWLASPLFIGGLCIEAFSLVVSFRPAAHRLWGTSLILFHVGIYFTLSIMFSWQVLLIGLLLVCSPWRQPDRSALASLPVVGDALALRRRLRSLGRAPEFGIVARAWRPRRLDGPSDLTLERSAVAVPSGDGYAARTRQNGNGTDHPGPRTPVSGPGPRDLS